MKRNIKLARTRNEFYRKVITKVLKKDFFLEGDGHTIFDPSYYILKGFPQTFVEKCTRTYESDLGGSPKNNIFDDDMHIIPALTGVYNLEILQRVASVVGADTKTADEAMGRGFRARALCHAIKLAIGVQTVTG